MFRSFVLYLFVSQFQLLLNCRAADDATSDAVASILHTAKEIKFVL